MRAVEDVAGRGQEAARQPGLKVRRETDAGQGCISTIEGEGRWERGARGWANREKSGAET